MWYSNSRFIFWWRIWLPSVATTLEYDGSSWTAGGSLNTAASYQAAGTQTATLGSESNSTSANGTESYNGTSWTAVADRNTARAQIAGFGSQTSAIVAGGYNVGPGTPQLTNAEQWNGSSWVTTASLGAAIRNSMGVGTQGSSDSGLITGGNNPSPYSNATEEFTGETTALNTKTLTSS